MLRELMRYFAELNIRIGMANGQREQIEAVEMEVVNETS
jgi:hypothetical protein